MLYSYILNTIRTTTFIYFLTYIYYLTWACFQAPSMVFVWTYTFFSVFFFLKCSFVCPLVFNCKVAETKLVQAQIPLPAVAVDS